MSFLEAIILGIIQGLTEFLPVSSSGHLELAKAIQDSDLTAEKSMLITVVMHFATALSTVVVFRSEIFQILKGLFQFRINEETMFSFKIILSMIPAALVGLLFESEIESFFNKQILLVGFMLIITGLLLFLADKAKVTEKKVSIGHSIIIGIAQAIAILPGISRSGATIGTSVLLGIDRDRAARFSFLMVVPLIFGKMAKDIGSEEFQQAMSSTDTGTAVSSSVLIVGFLAAFITGILACTWMIRLVRKAQLKYFSFYCFIVGIAAMIWYAL